VTTLTASKNGENFTAVVSNTGNAAARASTTQFKLDGTQMCAVSTPAIAAGSSATVACKVKAPKPGTHTLLATADSANVVSESDETNDSKTITFKK
jgi:subtilase family serine protease